MMDYRIVFASALGLTPPWGVVGTRFSLEERRLDIWVDFPPGSKKHLIAPLYKPDTARQLVANVLVKADVFFFSLFSQNSVQ